MMLRICLPLICLVTAWCGATASHSTAPNIADQPSASPTPVAVGNQNSNRLLSAEADASPTPALSECTVKHAVRLGKGINIPQELCVDEKKPIDKSEVLNVPSAYNAAYTWYEATDVEFAKLPPEVQKIVSLTAPEMDKNAVVFNLMIIPADDAARAKRIVKSYSYNSVSKEKVLPDPNIHRWIFKRQGGKLKLDAAELDWN